MFRPPHPPRINLKRLILGLAILAAIPMAIYWWLRTRPPGPLVEVVTIGGVGPRIRSEALSDPFGLAIDENRNVFVSDGLGGRIHRLSPDGRDQVIASGLNMPSALAFASDGSLIIANTGAHTLVRLNVINGATSLFAGSPDESGDVDGLGSEARFNGPVGIAIDTNNNIVVADTYNDRIRVIAADGRVSTLAGGPEPGFLDGRGADARFDTPCGVAMSTDGAILVADTGNHRIRRVARDGTVTTITGQSESGSRDGALSEATLDEPVAIAVRRGGAVFIADAGGSRIRAIIPAEAPLVSTVSGGFPTALIDGAIAQARFNRPSGLAFTANDVLVVTDAGNGFVRALVPSDQQGQGLGRFATSDEAVLSAKEIREKVKPRWPFEPADARREIAGTFGEIRGEALPEHDAWFHSGLDIPGSYGETVRALFDEQITLPVPVAGAGGPRERVRLPLFGYIHLRVGRDAHDRTLPGFDRLGFRLRIDDQGQISGVRLRRGARFHAGAPLGTLNRLNHVHLVAGPPGDEVNALAALDLPGLTDTTAPLIEDVTVTNEAGQSFTAERGIAGKRTVVSGNVRIIARAYDQVDGNASYRRLAPFRFAYQVLTESGAPARGFERPLETIVFERLPVESGTVPLVYAEGSQSGYEGRTIFAFLITNTVRDGKAQAGFWNASALEPGKYTLRVFAADFFGNRSQRDLPVRIAG
ncbi:MAG: hypothetical protein ABI882_03620 [Acidobacteriota bacterium]